MASHMKRLIARTSQRLMASLLRNHFSCVELLEGIARFAAPDFQPARRADWKEVGDTPLAIPSPRAQARKFAWRLCAAMLPFTAQITTSGAAPTVQWVKVAGSAGDDIPMDIALSPAGEIYLAGVFEGYNGGLPETVLHRFDRSGKLIGSQASRGEEIRGLAVDSQGNYYLTGKVWDSDRLGMGVINDFYLAKYSAAGTLLWERTAGTPTYSRNYVGQGGYKVAVDAAGNIYVVGASSGPAVFGNVTFPDTPGGPLLCKYDPDGTLLWVKRVEGAPDVIGTGGSASSVALDQEGNIVIAGSLNNGTANIGGMVVTIAGPYFGDGCIVKYDANGDAQWVRVAYGGGVKVDTQGNIYFGGGVWRNDKLALHCGKFSPIGESIWERIIFGALANSIALDGKEEPVFAAQFYGTVQLDEHVAQNDSTTDQDILICKADASGKFQWALAGGGITPTQATRVVSDASGNIYAAGDLFSVSGQADPGSLASFPLTLEFDGTRDFFITRLNDPSAVAVQLKITRAHSGVALSWPVQTTNYILEATTTLPAVSWATVTNTPTVTTNERSVQLPLAGNARFFRLRQP